MVFVAVGLLACGDRSPPTFVGSPCSSAKWSDEECIQGGSFEMGHDVLVEHPTPCPDGQVCGPGNPPPTDFAPKHSVTLPPFFLDRLPATNREYRQCFSEGICPDEAKGGGPFFTEYHMADLTLDSYPMATASAEGALAYCRWKGKRVATEAEWERVARNHGTLDYPWGNHPMSASKPLVSGWSQPWFAEVGAFAFDTSEEGIKDLLTGPQAILTDHYDYYYYANSPSSNPVSRGGNVDWVVRGDVQPHGDVTTSGYPTRPYPAWVRGEGAHGGIRCARTDDAHTPPQSFFTHRQQILGRVAQ